MPWPDIAGRGIFFLEAQDVGWTGGQISLKFGSGRSLRWLAFDCKYGQSRWMSLVQKELQLHEATMVLVPLFLLLHVAVITLAYFNPKWASDTHELICHAVPAVWLAAVPLVIGCVAVAGERRFNTLEGLLCLPVSKRASFAVKLIVALVLAVVLGGLLPWLLMRIQAAPLGDFTVWVAMGVAALIACVSFYASTMSNGLLQAMPTVVGIGFAVFLTSALGARTYGYFHQWRYQDYGFFMSSLFPALAWPAGVITFIWLSFRNYRQAQTGWGMWVENYVRVVAAFVCLYLVGMGIFYRDWQLFLPLEPRHGAARISGTGAATLVAWKKHAAVVLPDGRLWVGGGKEAWKVESGGFVADTNWVKVAAHYTGAIALKSDGTLWQIMGRTDLRQIGSDSDWADIAAGEGVFFAVKRDGTLWGWGHDHGDLLSEKSASENHGIDVPKPTQVQNGSDWVKIFLPSYGKAVAIKSDGSAWEWGWNTPASGGGGRTTHETVRLQLTGNDLAAISFIDNTTLAVRTDGTLRVTTRDARQIPAAFSAFSDLARVSDWKDLQGSWHITGLERSGALWSLENGEIKRPSRHSDWLATADAYGETWALARDGTLSCWNEFRVNSPPDPNKATFWQSFYLGPNRRPVLSLNIFDSP